MAEHFLGSAAELSLQVVPVLFGANARTMHEMLPAYAIDVDARRAGVRTILDAVTQPGGPRYVFTDQLMLEVCVRWIDEMLGAFAGHPAISMWDIGHDPAGAVRPHRIEHLRSWVALIANRIRERGERCMLSLSADDLVTARAVGQAEVGGLVDVLGLDITARALTEVGDPLDPAGAAFLVQLGQSLAASTPLIAHLSARAPLRGDDEDDGATQTDASMRRFAAGAVDALVDCGCVGLMAAMSSVPGPRAAAVPPFDRDERLRHVGVVDAAGSPSAFGSIWIEQARRERERSAPAPWPEHIDVADYYANLPESLHELRAAWERGSGEYPAMLR